MSLMGQPLSGGDVAALLTVEPMSGGEATMLLVVRPVSGGDGSMSLTGQPVSGGDAPMLLMDRPGSGGDTPMKPVEVPGHRKRSAVPVIGPKASKVAKKMRTIPAFFHGFGVIPPKIDITPRQKSRSRVLP
jgi:hypothetical protein